MTVDYETALNYLDNEVLHNGAWTAADYPMRYRALKNAENELYLEFPRFNRETKPLPNTAIFEQTLWILRKDDSILKAEMGVTNVNISGEFSMGLGGKSQRISPAAIRLVRINGKKVGRYL